MIKLSSIIKLQFIIKLSIIFMSMTGLLLCILEHKLGYIGLDSIVKISIYVLMILLFMNCLTEWIKNRIKKRNT